MAPALRVGARLRARYPVAVLQRLAFGLLASVEAVRGFVWRLRGACGRGRAQAQFCVPVPAAPRQAVARLFLATGRCVPAVGWVGTVGGKGHVATLARSIL